MEEEFVFLLDGENTKSIVSSSFVRWASRHLSVEITGLYNSSIHDNRFQYRLHHRDIITLMQCEYIRFSSFIGTKQPKSEPNSFSSALDRCFADKYDQPDFPFLFYLLGKYVFGCHEQEIETVVRFFCDIGFGKTVWSRNEEETIETFVMDLFRRMVDDSKEDIGSGSSRLMAWIYHIPVYYHEHPMLNEWTSTMEQYDRFLLLFRQNFLKHASLLTETMVGMMLAGVCDEAKWKSRLTISQTFFYLPLKGMKDRLVELRNKWVRQWSRKPHFWFQCTSLDSFRQWVQDKEEAISPSASLTMGRVANAIRKSILTIMSQTMFDEVIQDLEWLTTDTPERCRYFHQELSWMQPQLVVKVIYRKCFSLDQENEHLLTWIIQTVRMQCKRPMEMIDRFMNAQLTESMTEEQRQMLRQMLESSDSILYGPPGTGKTSRGLKAVVDYYLQDLKVDPSNIVCLAPTGQAFRELCSHLQSSSSSSLSPPMEHASDEVEELEEPTLKVLPTLPISVKVDNGPPDELELARLKKELVLAELRETEIGGAAVSDLDPLSLLEEGINPGKKRQDEEYKNLVRYTMMEPGGRRINGESVSDKNDRIDRFRNVIRGKLYQMFGFSRIPAFLSYQTLPDVPPPGQVHPLRTSPMYNSFLSGTLHRFDIVVKLLLRTDSWDDLKHGKRLVVFIDEASMFSAEMLNMLLKALYTIAQRKEVCIDQLIFCGDHRQLVPINYGSVLQPMIHSSLMAKEVRRYLRILRQDAASRDLVNVVTSFRDAIESGQSLLKIHVPTLFDGREAQPDPDWKERNQQPLASAEYLVSAMPARGTDDQKKERICGLIRNYPQWFAADYDERRPVAARVVTFRNKHKDLWNEVLQREYFELRQRHAEEWTLRRKEETDLSASTIKRFRVGFVLYDLIVRRKNIRIRMTIHGEKVTAEASLGGSSKKRNQKEEGGGRSGINWKRRRFSDSKPGSSSSSSLSDEEVSYLLSNGDHAFVIAMDMQRELVEIEYVLDGKRQILSFEEVNDQFRLAYANTVYSAQGSTHCKTVVDQETVWDKAQSVWVEVSRPSRFLGLIVPQETLEITNVMPMTNFCIHADNPYCAGQCSECLQEVISESVVQPTSWNGMEIVRREGKFDCPLCKGKKTIHVVYHSTVA